MFAPTVEAHRWTRQEFEQIASTGIFDPEARLELLDGEIFHMTPQSSWHATSVRMSEEVLRKIFRRGYDVRVQLPLAIDNRSLPEPDVAVVVGSLHDYRNAHPTTAVIVVEVADSTLTHDKERKRPRYAIAKIPEYWIINLSDYCLEIYREPIEDDYRTHLVLKPNEMFSPLAFPRISIAVSELLP